MQTEHIKSARKTTNKNFITQQKDKKFHKFNPKSIIFPINCVIIVGGSRTDNKKQQLKHPEREI